jgi:hypothetical protein
MWKNTTKFNPSKYVTRWQFSTVLSRMISWIEDWSWDKKYYEPKDIGYEKPSIELFTDKSTSFQFLTSIFENLNKLNSNIAYKHRYYFAKKYDIDIKKDLLKIEIENEDYLFKFRKNLPH